MSGPCNYSPTNGTWMKISPIKIFFASFLLSQFYRSCIDHNTTNRDTEILRDWSRVSPMLLSPPPQSPPTCFCTLPQVRNEFILCCVKPQELGVVIAVSHWLIAYCTLSLSPKLQKRGEMDFLTTFWETINIGNYQMQLGITGRIGI